MNPRDRRSKLWQIRDVAEAMRAEPPAAPDFTSAILDRVDAQRPFLAPSVRRRVPWVYAGLAGVSAAGVLSAVLLHRAAPSAMEFASGPAPVSTFANSLECAACRKFDALRATLARETTITPAPEEFLNTVAAVASVVELESAPAFPVTDSLPGAPSARPESFSQVVSIARSSPAADLRAHMIPTGSPAIRLAGSIPTQSLVPTLPGDPLPRAVLFSGDWRQIRSASHDRSLRALDADAMTLPR